MAVVTANGGGNRAVALLSAVTTTATSDTLQLRGGEHSVQVVITNTATVTIDVSNDPRCITDPANASWQAAIVNGGPTISASGAYSADGGYAFMRARVTAYTSGSVSVFAASCER